MSERQPTSKVDFSTKLPYSEDLTTVAGPVNNAEQPDSSIADIVKEGKSGSSYHRPDGKFISKHEQALIAEHANQIRDGVQERHDDADVAAAEEISRQDEESLETLAGLVAQARANSNEYSAHQAEDLFFDKFVELSDKYGWEENDGGPEADVVFIDDNTEDTALDTVTIDDRLAYYAEVMYGADNSAEQSPTSADTSDDENEDFSKARAVLDEYAKLKQPQINEGTDSLSDNEIKSDDNNEADKPLEDSGEGGTATEESPKQKAKHREELDARSLAKAREVLASWKEVREQVAQHRSDTWFSRARTAMNDKLTRLYYRTGNAINYAVATEQGDDESDEEHREKTKKRGRIGVAVGIVAVGALGVGLYTKLHGMDSGGGQPSTDGTFGGNLPLVPSPETSPPSGGSGGGGGEIVQSSLDNFSVPKGGNGEQVMAAAGRPASDWYNGLGDKLAERLPNEFTVITPNQSIWIDRPGELSDAAVKIIDNWKR